MIKHAIFPTLVLQDRYKDQENFKPIFLKNLFKYFTMEGYSNEFSGHVYMHHEESYAPFFIAITKLIEEYVRTIGIDPNLFDVNIIKTWMNITKERQTPFHSHEDAHLSFTYYPHIPNKIEKPLVFASTPPHMNDPYYGMISFNANERNIYNEYEHAFTPSEGDIFVFPAKLNHYTIGYGEDVKDTGVKSMEDLLDRRVCLAGDILFTYREVQPKPTGIQPIQNWRIFRDEV